MIYCDSPTLEEWVAPPQDDLPRPKWTKLLAGDLMLSNSVEFADWQADPVQPIACELCWHPGCAMAGLARIVNVKDLLVWVRPNWEDFSQSCYGWIGEQNLIRDSVVIPTKVWSDLRCQCPALPSATSFPTPRREDLINLWMSGMPKDVRVRSTGKLDEQFWQTIIAADPLELSETRRVVRELLDWVRANPKSPVEGEVIEATSFGGSLNSVFFEGPPFTEWIVFATAKKVSFVFDNRWVFQSVEDRN